MPRQKLSLIAATHLKAATTIAVSRYHIISSICSPTQTFYVQIAVMSGFVYHVLYTQCVFSFGDVRHITAYGGKGK